MPFISPKDQERLVKEGLNNVGAAITSLGDLAFCVYRLCGYQLYGGMEDPRFTDFAGVDGTLDTVKMQIFVDKILPYESRKRLINGEAWPAFRSETKKKPTP